MLDFMDAKEIAALVGLTDRMVQLRANSENWAFRPRSGRGGGKEYCVSKLPQEIREAIVAGLVSANAPTQPPAIIDTPAPVQPTSAGNVTKKQLDTAEARLVFIREIDRLARVDGKETAIQQIEKASREGNLAPHLQRLVAVANDKFGGGGKRGLSRRRLYEWCTVFAKDGVTGLIPRKSGRDMSIPVWFPFFLTYYQRPQKPSKALAHSDFCRDYPDHFDGPPPSYEAIKRILSKMARPALEEWRRTGNALLKLRPHKLRKTDMLLPGDVYTGDGTTFDAEIAHPEHGRPYKPEVTGIIDVATRKCVGLSLNLSENAFAVLDALRMACLFGGIPAMFYTDNGPGYRNEVLEAPALGMFARLGTEATYAIPGRPQGKGLMERAIKTLCDRAAKRMPTCTHADMDGDAAKKVFKLTRDQIKKHGKSDLLPTFDEFKKIILARVEEYNNTPHRALAKIVDPVSGKRRHMSPNEAWASFEAQGWEPVTVPEDMRDELFMPAVQRKVRNAMVEFFNGKYYAAELDQFHGDFVEVRYDIWNASYVYIYTLDGVRVCRADLDGNAIPYFPPSRIEAARATREAARIKRVEAKAQQIVPGAQVLLPEADAAFTMSDMFPGLELRQPEPVTIDLAPVAEAAAVPKMATSRPLFLSSQRKYVWLMENADQQTAADREWLHDYAYGEEYADLHEFYAFRGLGYPGAATPAN